MLSTLKKIYRKCNNFDQMAWLSQSNLVGIAQRMCLQGVYACKYGVCSWKQLKEIGAIEKNQMIIGIQI